MFASFLSNWFIYLFIYINNNKSIIIIIIIIIIINKAIKL